MSKDFRTLISALWGSLKLAPPKFGDTESIVLSIDGVDVRLTESPDGRHCLISGSVGRLSSDLHQSEMEVRRLLKTSLGLLQSNKAGLRLDTSGDAPTAIVEAAYPYAANRLDDFRKLIEDVLFRVELHAGDLAPSRSTRRVSEPTFTDLSQDNLILRP